MPGTAKGNRKTRDKLLAKDPDYYRKIGSKGGSAEHSYRYFKHLQENDPEKLKAISGSGSKKAR